MAAYRYRIEASTEWERGTKPGWIKALKSFQLALDLDPNYLDAHLGWGLALRDSDRSAHEIWPELRTRMRAVLQMDDTALQPRYWLGTIKWVYDYDWEGAKGDLSSLM